VSVTDHEVGALGQDGIVDSNDAKYGGAVHSHHYERYNVAHDEIEADGGRNRHHIHTYFDRHPYNDCYDTRSGDGVSVDYRFFNDEGSGDTDMDYENWEPREWMLKDSDYSYSAGFTVGYPITPWLSVSAASISMGTDGSSGNSVREDPYNFVEAHVEKEWGSALPDSEDDSDGFRSDVVAYRGTGLESLNFSSEFEYAQVCNRRYGYYTTGVIGDSYSVDIV
jgi:hypothetical protein